MRNRLKYRTIAVFLLTVFSLNTVLGFACSIGVDMGYNTKHHEHEKQHVHSHNGSHSHHSHGHPSAQTAKEQKDDCCANGVTKFNTLDKSVVQYNPGLSAPVFFPAGTLTCILQDQIEYGISIHSTFQFVRRSCFLNDISIRIAIQSFQI